MIGAFDRSILIVFIRVADSSGAVHALGKRLNLFSYRIAFGASSSSTQAVSETPATVDTPGSMPIVDVPMGRFLAGASSFRIISA